MRLRSIGATAASLMLLTVIGSGCAHEDKGTATRAEQAATRAEDAAKRAEAAAKASQTIPANKGSVRMLVLRRAEETPAASKKEPLPSRGRRTL